MWQKIFHKNSKKDIEIIVNHKISQVSNYQSFREEKYIPDNSKKGKFRITSSQSAQKNLRQNQVEEREHRELQKILNQQKEREQRKIQKRLNQQKEREQKKRQIKQKQKIQAQKQERITKQLTENEELLIKAHLPGRQKKCRNQIRNEIHQQRKRQLQVTKKILNADCSKIVIIWLFVIQEGNVNFSSDQKQEITQIYKKIQARDQKFIPLITVTYQLKRQLHRFLQMKNAVFKIVTDLNNAPLVFSYSGNQNILEFYLFNDQGHSGILKSLYYKQKTSKMKRTITNLDTIIAKCRRQTDDNIQILQSNNGNLLTRNLNSFFPSFLMLSSEDKSEATQYRILLYGAINLPQYDKVQRANDFCQFIREKYKLNKKQLESLNQYQGYTNNYLENPGKLSLEQHAHKVIEFYLKESFYYRTLNNMMRIMKTTEELKLFAYPFNQVYKAILFKYSADLKENNRKLQKVTLYRGTKLRQKDLKILQCNNFIEILGFLSTSHFTEGTEEEKILKAKGDFGQYAFIIEIPEIYIPVKYAKYDHGFIDINKHKLGKFKTEQEFLINALNIFKYRVVINQFIYKVNGSYQNIIIKIYK